MTTVRVQEITATQLFDGRIMRGPSRLVLRNGTVMDIHDHDGDCEYAVISPGLVDLQVNGWERIDCGTATVEDIERLSRDLAMLGTTSWLATLVTDTPQRMRERVTTLDAACHSVRGVLGIHLEGPFLGRSAGAHPRERIIDLDMDWIRALPPSVRLITIGAEQPSATAAIPEITERGIVVSIGHSLANATQFDSAVSSGASMVTHLYNAMSGVHHRQDGVALSALTDPRVTAGLIADMCHVSAPAVRLAFLAKPAEIALVSDSIAWNSQWANRMSVEVRDGAPRLPDGTLAGSSTSLAECVRRTVQMAGVDISVALRAATSTPARVVGRTDVGHLVTGRSCDIVAFDRDLHVCATWSRLVSSRGTTTDI